MTLVTLILVAFGAAAYLVLEQLTARRAAVAQQLQRVQADGPTMFVPARPRRRAGAAVASQLAAVAQRLQPGTSHEQLRRRLHMAGVHASPQQFLAAKSGLALLALAGAGAGALGGNDRALLLGPVFAVLMFLLPGCVLTMRQRRRRLQVELELPDALDLLTVSVEAGLGFDSAVQMVTQRMDGPLSDEFRVMIEEMRLGASRRQAMRAIGERTGSDEISSFVRSLLQSDELGVPIGAALRVQAEDMRTRRQLRAEEQATKAPVKLLFPTVLFIFPVIFMVIVAPAVMNVFDMLGSM
jgi:tight adherence protein C